MPYNFHERLSHVGRRLKEAGEEVTLTRDGEAPVEGLVAFPILEMAEEVIPGIAVTRMEYQDWTIDVADYDFGSGPVLPAIGDKLIRSTGEEFAVISPGGDEPPHRYTTSTRNRFRVHTQRIVA